MQCWESWQLWRWWIAIKGTRWFINKTEISDEWRVCTDCWERKPRNKYSRRITKKAIKRTPNCKVCRNKRKAMTRSKGENQDKTYKDRTRKLDIWTVIVFPKEITTDICNMIWWQVWIVVEYVYKKWYRLISSCTWFKRWLNTSKEIFRIVELTNP